MINLEKINLEKFQPHSLLENLPLHHTSNSLFLVFQIPPPIKIKIH